MPDKVPVTLLGLSDVVTRALSRWVSADASGRRFLVDAVRSQADLAVAAMDRSLPDFAPQPHRVTLSVRGEDMAGYGVRHPPECHRLAYGERCEFDLALTGARSLLPRELGVYDATVAGGVVEFTWARALSSDDRHG